VTPEVLLRKLTYLRQLLADLALFEGATVDEVQADHYTVERLFELLVVTASDILFHELAKQDLTPDSYRGRSSWQPSRDCCPPTWLVDYRRLPGCGT
jgi:hypothetical protein